MRACRRDRKRETATCARVIYSCKGVEKIRIKIDIEGDLSVFFRIDAYN